MQKDQMGDFKMNIKIKKKTVCILTAGKGSRVGEISKYINKSLLPIDKKAAISWIIEKFPPKTEFIIATGFLGHQVEQYLKIFHSDKDIKIVKVDNYDGIGSGPGHSLLCCKEYLNKPFYFVACDTLWENEIDMNLQDNWFAVSKVDSNKTSSYCNFLIKDGFVVGLKDKVYVQDENYKAFVGLSFIKDFEIFWNFLKKGDTTGEEKQVSRGIMGLIRSSKVKAIDLVWNDIGDLNGYSRMVKKFENFDFSKTNETIYIHNKKVVKFFADKEIVDKRVKRASLNPAIFPSIIDKSDNFYSYNFQEGKTLYEINSKKIFNKLLEWLSFNLWKKVDVEKEVFKNACFDFYKEKTFFRLNEYFKKYNDIEPKIINEEAIPSSLNLLSKVNWEYLCTGIPVFFHGDLQFDNILYINKKDDFCLIDWRQDFSGHIEFGDIYYDLAKLYGGIILNYDFVKKNLIYFDEQDERVSFDFAQRYSKNYLIECLEAFINSKNYDLKKIKLLTGLIYLNMSPLHHQPFDKLLNSLGRTIISKNLET